MLAPTTRLDWCDGSNGTVAALDTEMERIFLRGDVRRSNERNRRNRNARDEPMQDLSTCYLRGHAKSLSIPDRQ
jgi:hypothetical protein